MSQQKDAACVRTARAKGDPLRGGLTAGAKRSAGPAPQLRYRTPPAGAEDERELRRVLAAGRQGDPDAIRYLYDRYADDVYGYVRSIVRDEHEAEDVTQNVFIKLMGILHKYEERGVPFSAWMLRVSRNVALDHLRMRRTIPCEEVRNPDLHSSDGQLERGCSLRDALFTLSPDQRRVVLWRHLLGLSPVEIAQLLGKTEGSIHALHHRGRRAAQSELRDMDSGPSTMMRAKPRVAAA